MRILVTGLNGIIGWNVFLRASALFPASIGTYREFHPSLEGLNVTRLEPDSPQALEQLFQEFQPNIIIHSWAMCDLDVCEQFPEMAERINIEGTQVILRGAAGLKNLRRFVYISTDHVFDGEAGNYTEHDLPFPKHVYGRTKLAAEKKVQASGLPWQILRPGLVIGDSLQGRKGPKDFLLTRIRAQKPTHYFTDEWRTPIPAQEMAVRVVEIACSDREGIFHVAGAEIYNRYELAKKIAADHGFSSEHVYPRLREEDRWASIRPKNLSLRTVRA